MKKYYNNNKKKYWNDTVIFQRDNSLNQDIISEIEDKCKYDIIEINDHGKKKKSKKISVKNRDLYTRYRLNRELPYLKQYKHLVSVNPPGKKYLFFMNNFANKNNCIFINRYKDKNLNYEHQVLKINMNLDKDLHKGTLFDGQVVKKKDDKWYFVINDLFMYKGNNIMNNNFLDRLEIIKQILNDKKYFEKLDNPYVDCYKNIHDEVIYFEIKLYVDYKHGLDLSTNYYRYFNYFDNNEDFKNKKIYEDDYNGDIPKGIIFTNIDVNATQLHYVIPINQDEDTSVNEQQIDDKNENGDIYFQMRKNKKSDVYYLFCKKDDIIIEHGVAFIRDVNHSQKVNLYFKKDILEFNIENKNYDDQIINVKCKYNSKFKKWEPIDKVENIEISNYSNIKSIEEENISKELETAKFNYINIPEFNKNDYLVYNEYNEEITIEFLEDILNKYGVKHKIENYHLIKTAFVSKTYSKEYYIKGFNKYGNGNIAFKKAYQLITNSKKDTKKDCLELSDISSERLEWYGDAKLAEIISTYLENRYPNEDEGFLTKIRSKLVRKQTLAEIGMKLEFNKYVLMSKQIELYENGRNSLDISEDCFEAFIGALSKEFKYNKCEYKLTQFIINLYEEEIDLIDIIMTNDNYKTQIMEHFHKIKKKNPIYKEEITKDEITDEKIYHINVLEPINRQIIGNGTNKIRKKAEQMAAHNGLICLRIL